MKWRVLFLVACVFLALAGCDETEDAPSQGDDASRDVSQTGKAGKDGASVGAGAAVAGDKARIALVMKTLTNPFFVEMEKGARRAEAELGINLIVKTAAQETSIEQQIAIVEGLIQDKVDAFVIAPGDSVELIPVLKSAQDQGIVVVNIDNRLDPIVAEKVGLKNVPFISIDNRSAAYRSARALTEGLTEPVKAAIIEGIRDASNAEERKQGALRAFSEATQVSVAALETANWKIDESYRVTRELFEQHPDLDLIFAANDMMALGTLKYLEEAGRNDVKVAAFDALDEARAAVEAGRLVATVDQQAGEQGYLGVVFAVRALNGEDLPAETMVDVILVTR